MFFNHNCLQDLWVSTYERPLLPESITAHYRSQTTNVNHTLDSSCLYSCFGKQRNNTLTDGTNDHPDVANHQPANENSYNVIVSVSEKSQPVAGKGILNICQDGGSSSSIMNSVEDSGIVEGCVSEERMENEHERYCDNGVEVTGSKVSHEQCQRNKHCFSPLVSDSGCGNISMSNCADVELQHEEINNDTFISKKADGTVEERELNCSTQADLVAGDVKLLLIKHVKNCIQEIENTSKNYKFQFSIDQVTQVIATIINLVIIAPHYIQPYLDFSESFLSKNEHSDEQNVDDFGLPRAKNHLLCFVAEWFGNELSQLRDPILSKSELFKRKHISCIDNLPPAKSVVREIFPECMIKLFLSWMDRSIVPGLNSTKSEKPEPKRAKTCTVSDSLDGIGDGLYPFIQLLLEFANNCLVSGVAHVVYPRLLYSE